MSKEVNVELYDFLQNNETGLYKDKYNNIIPYVHVYFFNLEDFVKIIGSSWFDEGGIDVKMFNNTICIELDSIIESEGHYLSSYKNCFSEYDWEYYEEDIKRMEE